MNTCELIEKNAHTMAADAFHWSRAREVLMSNLDAWDECSVYRFSVLSEHCEIFMIEDANKLIELRQRYGWEGF